MSSRRGSLLQTLPTCTENYFSDISGVRYGEGMKVSFEAFVGELEARSPRSPGEPCAPLGGLLAAPECTENRLTTYPDYVHAACPAWNAGPS